VSQSAIEGKMQSGNGVPRAIGLGAAALVGFALLASSAAKLTDVGTVHIPRGASVETLQLRFEDQTDGGVAVRDASDNSIIYVVAPGTNGFIRATLRGLTRERIRSGVGSQTPFALIHWSDGTMSLEDSTTGRKVALEAFGPTNAQAFARLFAARSATR
jgi:putative photosynthetic complex assembly protein